MYCLCLSKYPAQHFNQPRPSSLTIYFHSALCICDLYLEREQVDDKVFYSIILLGDTKSKIVVLIVNCFLLLLPNLLFIAFFFFQFKQVRNNYIIFMNCTTSNYELFLLFSTPSLCQHFTTLTGQHKRSVSSKPNFHVQEPTSCSQDIAFHFNSCHKHCNSSSTTAEHLSFRLPSGVFAQHRDYLAFALFP